MGFYWPDEDEYDAAYELRDWTTLAKRVQQKPNAMFWPLLGARRSGKTWALKALEASINGAGAVGAEYVNLQGVKNIDDVEIPAATILLLDEPGRHLFQSTGREEVRRVGRVPNAAAIERFLQWCSKRKAEGKKLTLALTPAEWNVLCEVDEDRGFVDAKKIEDGRLGRLKAKSHPQIQQDPAAAALFAQLPEIWRRNPCLLSKILSFALDDPGDHCDPPLSDVALTELQQRTIEELCRRDKQDYLFYVLHEGLTRRQRDCLLRVAQRRSISKDDARILMQIGLLDKHPGKANHYAITDPVLAAHLPPPVRIHHVSDLHFGAKTARRVDAKDQGPIGEKLAKAGGDAPVRDDYLDWLGTLESHERPHLLVVSGDIAEWGQADELAEGRAWLEKAATLLEEHAGLGEGPRVLLVPGNHDVDWASTAGDAGDRKRHLPFAKAFDGTGWPFPHLEEPPTTRKPAHVRYPQARLEFALLGSSEYGGESDSAIDELVGVVRKTAEAHGNLDQQEKAQGVGRRYGRVDPGLVHDDDIQRLRRHEWQEPVRIAVLHHALTPMPTAAVEIAPYVGLINAGRLKGALAEREFCLVLHGHVHAESVSHERWSNQVLRDGMLIASAATLGSREAQERHGFNEVLVIREGSDYEIRVVPWERRGQTFAANSDKQQSIRVCEEEDEG